MKTILSAICLVAITVLDNHLRVLQIGPWYPMIQLLQEPSVLSHTSLLRQFPVQLFLQFLPYFPSSHAIILINIHMQ